MPHNKKTKALDFANQRNEGLSPRTGQYVIDPATNKLKKILEQPHIGLLVREATFAYIEQY